MIKYNISLKYARECFNVTASSYKNILQKHDIHYENKTVSPL